MRSKSGVAVFFCFILINFIALRAALDCTAETEPVQKEKNYKFSVGTELFYHKYEEANMQQNGTFYGLNADWRYYLKRFFLQAEGEFSIGEVDYTSPTSGDMDNIDNIIFEIRGLGGHGFDVSKNTIVYPFLGIGYRYLNDDSQGRLTDRNYFGYERESDYIYSPLGLESSTSLGNGWSIGIIAEYDLFWQGEQKSNLSGTISSYNDLSNDQDDGYGLRGSVKVRKDTAKHSIIFEPFIRYWNIDESDETDILYQGVIIGYGWEPENETVEYGVKLKVGF